MHRCCAKPMRIPSRLRQIVKLASSHRTASTVSRCYHLQHQIGLRGFAVNTAELAPPPPPETVTLKHRVEAAIACLQNDEICQRRASNDKDISAEMWKKITISLERDLLEGSGHRDLSGTLQALQQKCDLGSEREIDPSTFEAVCDNAYTYSRDLQTFGATAHTEEAVELGERSALLARGELLDGLAGGHWHRHTEFAELREDFLEACYGVWVREPISSLLSSFDGLLRLDDSFYARTLVDDAEAAAASSSSPPLVFRAHEARALAADAASAELAATHALRRAQRVAVWSGLAQRGRAVSERLYPLALAHSSESAFASELSREASLRRCSDMRAPHEWYPAARLMRRKVIYHGGPTNSGKTYHALQAMRKADPSKGGGVFCGPLRLLALEVFEELNLEGVYCSLATGQERKVVPTADHLSCTIEMVNVNKVYDVAVVDEIQMIGDSTRGHAWTRALLGLQANELHVCGSLEAEQLVRELCLQTGDDFEVVRYERMSPFAVTEEALGDYRNVRPGDCVVAFSKADIFKIVEAIERLTSLKCCVVYGQLPPETRSKQAHLFNDPNSGFDVLVASDAIGMGLNLNIGRVIFHSTEKITDSHPTTQTKPDAGYDKFIGADAKKGVTGGGKKKGGGGNEKKKGRVEVSMMKQIAGRAGRRSSQYQNQGLATCLKKEDMAWLRQALAAPVKQVEAAGLFPAVEHLQAYSDLVERLDAKDDEDDDEEEEEEEARVNGGTPRQQKVARRKLSEIMSMFMRTARLPHGGDEEQVEEEEGREDVSGDAAGGKVKYFVCKHDEPASVADKLHDVLGKVSLTDSFTFCMAPVRSDDRLSFSMLSSFAQAWATGKPAALNLRFPTTTPKDVLELSDLCTKHNIIDLYLWLANRFPANFVEREQALAQKALAIALIQQGLEKLEVDLDDIAKMRYSYFRQNGPAQRGEKNGRSPSRSSDSSTNRQSQGTAVAKSKGKSTRPPKTRVLSAPGYVSAYKSKKTKTKAPRSKKVLVP